MCRLLTFGFWLGKSVDTTNEADDGRHRNESVYIENIDDKLV